MNSWIAEVGLSLWGEAETIVDSERPAAAKVEQLRAAISRAHARAGSEPLERTGMRPGWVLVSHPDFATKIVGSGLPRTVTTITPDITAAYRLLYEGQASGILLMHWTQLDGFIEVFDGPLRPPSPQVRSRPENRRPNVLSTPEHRRAVIAGSTYRQGGSR